ncbi:MAG: ECF transporter S component [Candidatus Cloacimonetes bacterium]|nr:ECF transporter S component [Candidatus Cloacimonadota bacterium]
MKWYFLVGLTVMVMVTTLIIRVPLPGGGYFNFGDVVVVFAGLFAGSKVSMIAGGVGSALADLIGFPIFAPLTLVAKGLEGFFCGFAHKRKGFLYFFAPATGVLTMVTIYLIGGVYYPQIGLAGALSELPANLIQAGGGYLGGMLLHRAFIRLEL